MPSSSEILAGLETVANEWSGLAIAWHAALAAFLVSFLLGWRPGKRLMSGLLAAPLASVSVVAWQGGNPFNGAVFAALASGLVGLAASLPRARVELGGRWFVAAGGVLTAFGWFYPHFLVGVSWTAYAYAAPSGLIPCPSLAVVLGVALIVGGLGSRGVSLVLVLAGALYGLVGVFRLGVVIDVVLLAGALMLVPVAVRPLPRVTGRVPTGGRAGG